MRQKQKLLIIGFICGLFFLMISCFPTKQTSEFRQLKREVDTLIVISPYLEITAFDFREKTPDSLLAKRNKELITTVTNQLLSSRYALKHIEMPELDRDKLLALFYDLDNSSVTNTINKKQPFFPALKEIDNNQLAMIITFHAEYNSVTTALSSRSNFGTHTAVITPSARPRSDLRLIVFNLHTDEIIFYNRYDTRNYSASSPADMEKMTRKILRDIYYK
jgi:hypothetical protein